MNRRKQIEMSPEEILRFLDDESVAVVSSLGSRGWPHSMPLWYVIRDENVWVWTFRKSQKVKNLKRDPRATVLVEAGDGYAELRGVQIEAKAVFHEDLDLILGLADELVERYAPAGQKPSPAARETFRAQAPKRIVIEFTPLRTVSWDHRKLSGVY